MTELWGRVLRARKASILKMDFKQDISYKPGHLVSISSCVYFPFVILKPLIKTSFKYCSLVSAVLIEDKAHVFLMISLALRGRGRERQFKNTLWGTRIKLKGLTAPFQSGLTLPW